MRAPSSTNSSLSYRVRRARWAGAEALLQLVQQARADTLLPGRIDDRLKPDMDDADAAGDQDKGYQRYNGYQN